MKINNHDIEFLEDCHVYICDGIIVPSVTTIIEEYYKSPVKVSEEKLKLAGQLGTQMHKDIENYERYGTKSKTKEFKNYLFLKEKIGFKNIDNEQIVLYEEDGQVLYIGTTDQIIELDDKLGINDFKRVSVFNKEKVMLQTTLYAIAYEQTYKKKIDFISGTHLKEDKRKFYKMIRCDKKALELVYRYKDKINKF